VAVVNDDEKQRQNLNQQTADLFGTETQPALQKLEYKVR
jgi:hypothetical protein